MGKNIFVGIILAFVVIVCINATPIGSNIKEGDNSIDDLGNVQEELKELNRVTRQYPCSGGMGFPGPGGMGFPGPLGILLGAAGGGQRFGPGAFGGPFGGGPFGAAGGNLTQMIAIARQVLNALDAYQASQAPAAGGVDAGGQIGGVDQNALAYTMRRRPIIK